MVSEIHDILHNFVVTTPCSATEGVELAIKLGISGEWLSYIPSIQKYYEYVWFYPGYYKVKLAILEFENQSKNSSTYEDYRT